MIRDGFLEKMGIARLVALEPIEPETEPCLAAFRARGGRVSDGSDFPPPPLSLVYRTVHRDFISTFTPSTGEIGFLERPAAVRSVNRRPNESR